MKNTGHGGDHDTDRIVVSFNDTQDSLYIYGFNPRQECVNPSNENVEYVAITDGQDYRGGLNSTNKTTALAFNMAKKYFQAKTFNVVNTIKDFF